MNDNDTLLLEGRHDRPGKATSNTKASKAQCPYCMGGNPLDYLRCQWCGAPLDVPSASRAHQPPPPPPAAYKGADGQHSQPSLLETADPIDIVKVAGNWLNKIGIVLFLLGVAFFFKYSVDQGWFDEAMRVNIGLALGTTLLVAGFVIKREHPHLSQVLLGGSIATYYIAAFAAFRLFHIDYVTFEVAFGFMAGITLLAFILAVTQDGVMLALIGAAGGLATPFVLYTGNVGLPDLVVYTCFVMIGTVAIYMHKGWRSLLWTSFFGSWLVFALGYISNAWSYPPTLEPDRWVFQAGIGVAALAFWIAPVLREALQSVDPQRWPDPTLPSALMPHKSYASAVFPLDAHPHVMSILTPFLAIGFSAATWGADVPPQAWGWIALGGAALYGFTMYSLQPHNRILAGTQGIAGIMLLTIGLALILEGDTLLIALAAEAAALVLVGGRLRSMTAALSGHLLSSGVAMWMLQRFVYTRQEPAILNAQALSELAVIGLALGVSILARYKEEKWIYGVIAHAGMLGLLWRELLPAENGGQWVLLSWAIYGMLIHLSAWWRKDQIARWTAHVVWGATGLWFLFDIAMGLILTIPDDVPFFNVRGVKGLTDLGVIAAAAIAYLILRGRKEALAYALGLHLAYLGWTWQQLGLMHNGNGYVSAAWGGYAIVLVAAAMYMNRNRPMLYAGISTLFIVAGKLFLVDLRYLEPFWRSLLFIGFGGLFLLLSYSFHRITRRAYAGTIDEEGHTIGA